MTNPPYRNTLIAAGIAATLGFGAAGCSETADPSSTQDATNQRSSDSAITSGVKAKLAQDDNLDSADISVATTNGTVTLTGSVNDRAASSTAERATRSFAGVTDVNNRLSLAAASRTTGEAIKETGDSATQAVSDTWITTKVKSVLLADSEAKGLDVEVNTKDGVVTLEGKLTNQTAADHVKALVMDVEGVKRVNTQALTIASR